MNNKNLYYNTEAFGLESLGSIEVTGADYEFDILACLYDPKLKAFYLIADSGCSCPTPFEDFTSRDALGEALSAHEAVSRIKSAVAGATASRYNAGPDDSSDLIAAIMRRN